VAVSLSCLAPAIESIERDGFAILPAVVESVQVAWLIAATSVLSTEHEGAILRRDGDVYGVRDLLTRLPEIRNLAGSSGVLNIVRSIIGPRAFAVRGLFFDKTPGANWNLPWHQDVTVAVKERREAAGFGPWTLKAKIPHAHAPADLLARMITIRVHLDPCGPENGPMRVLPGSHAGGRLSASEIHSWVARARELSVDCLVPPGGAVVMRPLILHASAAATVDGHRRVVHLEYAAEDLPAGLEWHQKG
jgi:ectoine hydroxylase-related dioxygenase (phytanoyl-CoA dioxygenase family)